MKVALRTGASLVPVYAFGENSTFRWGQAGLGREGWGCGEATQAQTPLDEDAAGGREAQLEVRWWWPGIKGQDEMGGWLGASAAGGS